MGRMESFQDRFFYTFWLDDVVRSDHLVRRIDAVLDPIWLHGEPEPCYSHTGRPGRHAEGQIIAGARAAKDAKGRNFGHGGKINGGTGLSITKWIDQYFFWKSQNFRSSWR